MEELLQHPFVTQPFLSPTSNFHFPPSTPSTPAAPPSSHLHHAVFALLTGVSNPYSAPLFHLRFSSFLPFRPRLSHGSGGEEETPSLSLLPPS